MAGGHVAYRHLSRNSAHRQALLRNLITSLIEKESIRTTWPKAKEAQRLAEKLITLAKRNNETSRRKAQGILYVRFFVPLDFMHDAKWGRGWCLSGRRKGKSKRKTQKKHKRREGFGKADLTGLTD